MRLAPGSISILLLTLLSALSGAGCRKNETTTALPGSNVVAMVSGTPIFAEALASEVSRRFGNSAAITSAQRNEALDALIRKEALYAKAVAAGFDRKPEIQARIRTMVAERFADGAFPVVAEPVSDLIVSNSYMADRAKFTVPGAVRYASIFISSPTKASPEAKKSAEEKMAALLAEAKASPDSFSALVARVSEDQTTRYRGGDAGWIALDGRGSDPALVAELKKLSKPGDIGGLVRTERGFQIIKLIEIRPETVRPLAEVRDRIRHELIRHNAGEAERRSALAIREGLDIQIFKERVDAISTPAGEPRPPAGPGGTRAEVSQAAVKPISE